MQYHIPVMMEECIQGLAIKQGGIYVDVTFGGGGHSKEILKNLENGRLFSLDQDPEAENNVKYIGDDRLVFIPGNFRHLNRYLKLYGVSGVDGLLADLGISSHHIDTPARGFSIRSESQLDMRMDLGESLTAIQIINDYSREQLVKLFREYAEIKNAGKLAQTIVRERINQPINTTAELISVIKPLAPPRRENKYFAQVFQALRIEVNDEINALKSLLEQSAEIINKGGRMVIMSYHSLEDRLVKNFINKGNFEGMEEKDLYGNVDKPFRTINRKPVTASAEEIKKNPRARSAKLRIAEKI